MARMKFMNTEIDNLTMQETLQAIDQLIQENKSAYVVTPNVDHIVQLETNKELQAVYKHASLILTDGKPLLWIASWYGTPIKEKISGSDLFPFLCKMAAEKGYKMFFLGAAEGVAAKAAENLMNRFKGLQVVGTYSPPFGFEKDPVEMDKIKSMIKEAAPHILIVGLGCPKQEKFMYHHCAELGVPISFGLGASFDFEAGNIKRAPRWMANHGLEWLFRITQDPKRMASLLVKTCSFLAILLLVKTKQDYVIYALISSFGTGANYLFNVFHARAFIRFDFTELRIKRHLKSVFTIFLIIFLSTIYAKIDTTMLGAMATEESVGYYTYAQKTVNIVIMMGNAVTASLLPRLSYYYDSDRKSFYKLLDKAFQVMCVTLLPLCVGLFLVANHAVIFLYGAEFQPTALTIRLLCPLILIKGFGDLYCYQMAYASKNEKIIVPASATASAINVATNAVLIPSLVEALFVYLKQNDCQVPKTGKLREAFTYALNQEKYLITCIRKIIR